MAARGTVVFTSVGRPLYGFDVFCITVSPECGTVRELVDYRLTDGTSVNYNAQFIDDHQTVVFVSERGGAADIFRTSAADTLAEHFRVHRIPTVPDSHFLDRPTIKNGTLYFVSSHEDAGRPFKSSSAVYSMASEGGKVTRLSPPGFVDYSPAISQSGRWIAVASYGSGEWKGDFHEIATEIVVFRPENPTSRVIVSGGGWPTWSGDSTVFFHRKCEDGWWSIFRVDLPEKLNESTSSPIIPEPKRITPPGFHALTPAASHTGKWIALATRRPETKFRHVEVLNLDTGNFTRLTECTSPSLHHYNPFVSPSSEFVGYHRFRGESATGDTIIPEIERVRSPIPDLRMLRLTGAFAAFSPDGRFIAFNPGFEGVTGVRILDSSGRRRWTVVKDRVAFSVAWSPKEKGVIYTTLGPIFHPVQSTVQIARISFNPMDLDDREQVPATVKILTRAETGNNAFPSCSPDGRFIVFRSGRTGHKNLYILDAVEGEDGGEGIRQLTEGEWIDTMPSWSPDGNWIAFSSNRHNPQNSAAFSIYLIRPDGSDLRRVYVAGGPGSSEADRERINHVCFSPDSKWLLFTANMGAVSAEPVSLPNHFQPYGEIYFARLDGTGLRRLTCNAYENGTPAWHDHGDSSFDIESLTLDTIGDKLTGNFDEPLWLTC
ncbi:unnamed protein product [Victoria cruziana]